MTRQLEKLVQEIHDEATAPPALPSPALRSGRSYSPEAMVQLMIDHPDWTHTELAAAFGRPPSWTSAVLASDAFQKALDGRRHEVADPSLSATMEERYKALAIQAATVLAKKLDSPGVSDLVVIQATGLGIKALGLGQKAPEALPPPAAQNSSESVAEKLLRAMDQRDAERDRARTIDVETVEVRDGTDSGVSST